MNDALIGYTGFVGTTLLKQTSFDFIYRSTNISSIQSMNFDTVVCAGAPAQKWLANLNPIEDQGKIEGLISYLRTISCKRFILISTVDVFNNSMPIDEGSPVDESGLHAYGLHRRLLEKFVVSHFPNYLIVRLPGLVGPGLRKNVIFDLLNDRNIEHVDSRSVFQFYPMVNLWFDIQTALDAGLDLIHLTAEPISVADVSAQCFGRVFKQTLTNSPTRYDMRTLHSQLFGSQRNYQYSRRETIQAIRAYAQSEPCSIMPPQGENS